MRRRPIPVLIASDLEWRIARRYYAVSHVQAEPFDSFTRRIRCVGFDQPVLLIRTGCGKVAAAAGAQYGIDLCGPDLLINLGTCGGFHGAVNVGDVLVVRKASVYDVHERTGQAERETLKRRVVIPLSWLPRPWPNAAKPGNIATADQDLDPSLMPVLRRGPFEACAADWESAAVAWVARKNNTRCLIIRGVSDVVRDSPSTEREITHGAKNIMNALFAALPEWLRLVRSGER